MRTSFHRFHNSWTDQLSQLISQLGDNESNGRAHRLVEKVVDHYEDYFRVKSDTAHSDVLSLIAAPWASSLERALYWIAGFRPTTIFHLIYTESSIRFEGRVANILQGQRTGDMGDLSPMQLGRVSELQCMTVKEENRIGEELGAWQMAVAGVQVQWPSRTRSNRLEVLLEKLGQILVKADELRMSSIKRVVELLTPEQAKEFLVAVVEFQLGLSRWGSFHDRQRGINH